MADSPARPAGAPGTGDVGVTSRATGGRRLPVLDLRQYGPAARPAERAAFLDALRSACRDPGFFHLTGHAVPPYLTERVLAVSRAFFHLPAEAKLDIENVHSPHFRGYTRLGQEITRGHPDLREQIDIGDERAARTLGPGDPAYLRLDGPNQWPARVPELRGVTLEYQAALGRLAQVLVRALAESLGLPADHLDATFATEPRSHVKLLRYLAAPDRFGPGYDQGVGAHKDGGFLSLVLQDEIRPLEPARPRSSDSPGPGPSSSSGPAGPTAAGVPSLQVADGSGGWIDAAPEPGAFVVNIGEMFELATRRYYRATVHRVMSPPPGHERVSVAFFFGPSLSVTLAPVPLPAYILAQLPDAEPPDPQNPIFAQHGENTLKSWLRSHPEVARRYYADLAPTTGSPR